MKCVIKNRHKVLTFQTPLTKGTISSLAEKNIENWVLEDVKRLFNLYINTLAENNTLDFLEKKSLLLTERKPKRLFLSYNNSSNKKLNCDGQKKLNYSSKSSKNLRLKNEGNNLDS